MGLPVVEPAVVTGGVRGGVGWEEELLLGGEAEGGVQEHGGAEEGAERRIEEWLAQGEKAEMGGSQEVGAEGLTTESSCGQHFPN